MFQFQYLKLNRRSGIKHGQISEKYTKIMVIKADGDQYNLLVNEHTDVQHVKYLSQNKPDAVN